MMSDDPIAAQRVAPAGKVLQFRQALLSWGKTYIRSYPWRYLKDPYQVLVSEFMLHRTQARQVVPVYEEFINRYPSLEAYSRADRVEVEQILKSLGLHWRIRGMMSALDHFWENFRAVPASYEQLLSVPTIGQYIAGAVLCFTMDQPLPLVDSNIVRVVGRVFGLDLRGEARRKKPVFQSITAVVDPDHPQDFYYAMIDLAHTICRPRNPTCSSCPLLSVPCQFGISSLKDPSSNH